MGARVAPSWQQPRALLGTGGGSSRETAHSHYFSAIAVESERQGPSCQASSWTLGQSLEAKGQRCLSVAF